MKKLLISIVLLNLFLSVNLFAAKNLYLSYKSIPKKVYKNQRFEVVVKALITTNNFDSLSSSFSTGKNIKLLNPNSSWTKVSNDIYENRYIFKINEGDFTLPKITTKLLKGSTTIDISSLGVPYIAYSDIAVGDSRFSGIIADELVLKAYKTKQYNNNDALTIVDIEGINSNLENFKIDGALEQGISDLKDNYTNQNLVYYFVTPVHEKKVVITYYNTKLKSFKEITIPLVLQNELVSTQTDLNPNDSSFEKYKKIAVAILFLIALALYIWKRKKFLLVITIILFIISAIYLMPNQTGTVKKDSYIYILPTKNSTIFFKLDSAQKVEKLQKRNGFVKVIGIDNKFIGWVKEESFGKN
jgi:hypothetical protein